MEIPAAKQREIDEAVTATRLRHPGLTDVISRCLVGWDVAIPPVAYQALVVKVGEWLDEREWSAVIPADLTPDALREIAHEMEQLQGKVTHDAVFHPVFVWQLREWADVLAVGEQAATSMRVGPHRYFPDDLQYAGDCRVCGHVRDDPLHAAVGEQETADRCGHCGHRKDEHDRVFSDHPWPCLVKIDVEEYCDCSDFQPERLAGEHVEPRVPPAANAWVERATQALAQAVTAFRLTREYLGDDVLPAIPGWSWFDAVTEIESVLAQEPASVSSPTPPDRDAIELVLRGHLPVSAGDGGPMLCICNMRLTFDGPVAHRKHVADALIAAGVSSPTPTREEVTDIVARYVGRPANSHDEALNVAGNLLDALMKRGWLAVSDAETAT